MKHLLILIVVFYTTRSVNGCGGFLNSASGYVKSPNFPDVYPPNTFCTWVIAVEEGSTISLTMQVLEVEGCPYDYLVVYDGPDASNYPTLETFCVSITSASSPVVRSTNNTMTLLMISDYSYNLKGFKAHYQTENLSGCGGNIADNNGTITSPGYPGNYGFMLDCTWVINVTVGYNITLVLTDLDMEASHICTYDAVKIYDGPDDTYPELGLLCGNTLPDPNMFNSTSNTMSIVMLSDNRISGRGFAAEYGIGNGFSNAVVTTPPPGSNAEGQSYGAALLAFLACHVFMLLL